MLIILLFAKNVNIFLLPDRNRKLIILHNKKAPPYSDFSPNFTCYKSKMRVNNKCARSKDIALTQF